MAGRGWGQVAHRLAASFLCALGAAGFNYTAADQSEQVTLERIASGECYVVVDAAGLCGTILFKRPDRTSVVHDSLPSEAALTNILGSISRLVAVGVTNIQVARLPEAIPDFADTAKRLNPVIEHAVAIASNVHPRASVLVSEWGSYFDHVLDNWRHYGFVEPVVPCAPGEVRLDQPLVLTGDPKLHCYITQGHPSAVVHHIVGTRLAAGLVYGQS